MGKTRLARELMSRLDAEGWKAGFVAHGLDRHGSRRDLALLTRVPTPMLLVTDEAETRDEELGWLLPMLVEARSSKTVRVLLLARTTGDWWKHVHRMVPSSSTTISRLSPLGDSSIRQGWFLDAVAGFAQALESQDQSVDWQERAASIAVPPDLNSEHYSSPLGLEVAALLALLPADGVHGDSPSQGRQSIDLRVEAYRGALEAGRKELQPELARALLDQGRVLESRGSRIVALNAFEQAVAIWRELAAEEPDQFRPALADALSAMSSALASVGRRDEARSATEEAVDIHRNLQVVHEQAPTPELAASLTNRAAALASTGHIREALTASEEAVDIYRRLADERPQVFRPQLAAALNNLSIQLGRLGRLEDALTAAQEATQIYRQSADERPQVFRPQLAAALNNLSIQLGRLGRLEDALTAAQEATQIYRRLADANPEAFVPDLAAALNSLSIQLGRLGRLEDALTAAQEATQIYRRLADANPEAFLPDLAATQTSLGARLTELREFEGAFAIDREALQTYLWLHDREPDRYRDGMRKAIGNLLIDLRDLGKSEDEARDSVKEIVGDRWESLAVDASAVDVAATVNEWEPIIAEITAVAVGQRETADELTAFLDELAAHGEWAQLAAVVRRILNGEHDEELLADLDPIDTAIIQEVLRRVSAQRSASGGK
jgi:tetratricopeptide (TPR) repeat protein